MLACVQYPRGTGVPVMPKSSAMWFVNEPQPLHHVTVVRRFQHMPEGFSARVLILRRSDGSIQEYDPLTRFQLAFPHRSSSWQNTVVRAMGLFWDYCATAPADMSARDLFRRFALALVSGTIKSDGSDATGLLWPSTPRERAVEFVKRIEGFAQWCAAENEEFVPAIAPTEEPLIPGSAQHMTEMLVWGRLRQLSMLQHIKAAPTTAHKSSVDRGPEPRGHAAEPVKFFPPAHAERLLWEGHARPGLETAPNVFLRYNIRDIMIALLDGWGSLRRSEGLHLWINDVTDDPLKPGHALVVLHHPSEARVEWFNRESGREEKLTRREILKREYGLLPRNVAKRGAYHVGWKGMDLDRNYRASVFWIDDNAAALFQILYYGYIRFVRPVVMEERRRLGGRDHPFLFVSERVNAKTGLPGEPYSETAYERNHRAAVERIGLVHGKNFGTTTHGLRHLYGRTMTKLGVISQVISKGLHHRNPLSQAPYAAPDADTVNEQLNVAKRKIADGHLPVARFSGTTAAALLGLRNFLNE